MTAFSGWYCKLAFSSKTFGATFSDLAEHKQIESKLVLGSQVSWLALI